MDTTEATAKERMIQFIRGLPDDSPYDDIMYHLYLRRKIETALADVDAGRAVSAEDCATRSSSLATPTRLSVVNAR